MQRSQKGDVNMSYQVLISRTIDEIGRDQWEGLTIPSCYLSYNWLKTVETRQQSNVYYVTVIDESKQVVAVAPCYLVSQPNVYTTYNLRDILAGKFALNNIQKYLSPHQRQIQKECEHYIQTQAGSQLFPNLLCTAREGYASSPIFGKYLDIEEKKLIASMIVDRVINLGQELSCLAVSFLYVEKSNPITPVLSGEDYIQITMDSGACLKLSQGRFEDYLQSLAKNKRTSVRRERRSFQQGRLIADVQNIVSLPTKRLALLLQNVQAKYGHKVGIDSRGFEAQIDRFKQISLPTYVYTAHVDNEIAGFALFFQYERAMFLRIVGFDYKLLNKNDFCYFNIAFYQPIADALNRDIDRIDYGMGALEGKLARGCTLVPTYGYFFCKEDSMNDSVLRTNAALVTQAQEQAYAALQEKF